jgi:hypothetical protein
MCPQLISRYSILKIEIQVSLHSLKLQENSCLGKYHRIEVVYHTWPKQKEGTTAAPASIATFTKPYLFLRNTTCKLEEAQ